MNSLTINLENDHEYILRLSDVINQITVAENFEISDIETIIDLIKNFADGFHHLKEEKLLFPILERKGFPLLKTPLSTILIEHEEGRKYTNEASAALIKYKEGIEDYKKKVLLNIKLYVTLINTHIEKENQILYKMADTVLSENDHQYLLKNFLKAEKSNLCGRIISNYKTTIMDLEKKYLFENQLI